jgi:drug/metabolite transporter (DMT)-like permease
VAVARSGRAARLADWALLLLCNLIWASQFVLAKLVQEQMGPVFATFVPMTLATLLLVPILQRERRAGGVTGRPPSRDVLRFVVIGVLGQVAAQLLVTWGVGIAPASNAALLSLTLPVVTAVLAFLILGERMTGIRWASFALALLGVLQCSGIDWRSLAFTDRRFLAGNLLIMGGVEEALYNVYGKRSWRYTPVGSRLQLLRRGGDPSRSRCPSSRGFAAMPPSAARRGWGCSWPSSSTRSRW